MLLPLENPPNSVKPLAGNTEPRRGRAPEGVETRCGGFTCSVCKTEKITNEFYVKDRGTGRRDTTCKACRIIQHRERTLGVSQEDYMQMHAAQDGRCGICKKRLRSRRCKAFAVDHCHTTGRIRGLLCSNCNTALGLLKDDPAVMLRAAEWVKV